MISLVIERLETADHGQRGISQFHFTFDFLHRFTSTGCAERHMPLSGLQTCFRCLRKKWRRERNERVKRIEREKKCQRKEMK